MNDMRKITVRVPEELLQNAQAFTGVGVTETARAGLQKLATIRAQQEFRKLRGTHRFCIDLMALHADED